MRQSMLLVPLTAAVLTVAIVSPAHAAGGKVIYDSTVRPLPGNMPSVGPEAYSFKELGDEVTFADQSRSVRRVTITLSSWACQTGSWFAKNCVSGAEATFAVPITFNIYSPGADNRAGTLIATRTQTFEVPYRPSTDSAHCPDGQWFDGKQGCFNGIAVNLTFDFSAQDLTLPDTIVFGIAYNTSHYGPNPIGASAACYTSAGGCPYDSTNIGLAPKVVVGSKPFPNTLYQNAVSGDYCDSGAAGVGVMRLDSPTSACWGGYNPAVRFTAAGRGHHDQGNDDQSNDDLRNVDGD